ncbi:MarR family winged helix-turn-helix transcriptional regulator [Mycobacteroides salmoniphilum]|uniref:Multiple antibiotic resistance protein MarR n=1 Tax=Mycobacteroides salmoniphilum TaxID=404941 RepID=A0A4R8SXY7_9MYCO|nr:MarR family winged helix-turn-helix transcriptional regulator [Mycobacteroides salmoniphilum]TDZ92378.1 Multiple antibiotic resistance protein MarR [Mycobacteroides salmoniphilum]TEA08203.1 Multiple antibiotic resistance protein MarR [Mycobacteroides salmoniphilum]
MADVELIFSELVRWQIQLWNAVDARLRSDFDLPLSRYEPMRVIERRGVCRVNDIAADLLITVGGTSKLVDRIEASGHCRRRPNPEDGRSSVIELTSSGKRLLAQAKLALEEELSTRLGAVLSAGELQQFATILTKVRAAEQNSSAKSRGVL